MAERKELHPRNKHSEAYDFGKLVEEYGGLKKHVIRNEFDTLTIDFFNPMAVRALNKALLISHYGISYWNIPKDALCPPIPGRADYIHYVSDLTDADGTIYKDKKCHCLDIGVGANCIYPIIGCREYGWTFVGSDINDDSLANAHKIITCNPVLAHQIELRKQPDCLHKFKDIIGPDEYFDATFCNPPFHDSGEQAARNAALKESSLRGKTVKKATLNFGGVSNELWCEGGELNFLINMIKESSEFGSRVRWFTTLVSKEKNLTPLYKQLKRTGVAEYKTINMSQGTKTSRLLAWRF